ncbi:MAG: low-specificity L-threonine aldolase [Flavobacteriales bacterium]
MKNRIDLRSDTVTRPTEAMMNAMMQAQVGDDVFGEDPTVNELQQFAADYFGMEAALYCSSGTQTNQIAIQVHTRPGDEVICSSLAHVYLYEGGGIAQNAGASVRLIDAPRGMFTASDVSANVNADDPHYPKTTLVCVENTMNKGGGAIFPMDELRAIRKVCDEKGLMLHCDGARMLNAVVASGEDPKTYGQLFHSISICLSKGLGAPVGSLLLGSRDFIYRAHRRRKSMGGGMRQAGIIAAAGLYALQHHVSRLSEDHERARQLASALQTCEWVKDVMPVDTNIVIAEMPEGISSGAVMQALASRGILCFTFGPTKIRLVTHLDFSDDQLQQCIEIFPQIKRSDFHSIGQERLAGMY